MTSLSDAALDRLRTLGDGLALDGTRYELLGELGRGGMGTVYRVRDRELGREVALKVTADLAPTPDAARRLRREARALARLEHPGIVPVHDAGTLPDGRVFYTMKLVRGERLDQRLTRGLLPGDALRLFSRVAEAVAFAHANGVIHRDLKPQNIMIGAFGEVLVLDWGLAKVRAELAEAGLPGAQPPSPAATGSEPASTLDGVVIGTPGYMAPEQAAGNTLAVDERTDVFALGAILRDLAAATGARPGRPLAAIVARATAPDPADRYPSVQAVNEDVARLQDGHPVTAYRENVLERVARLARRHRTAVALVVAYLLMRIALLLLTGR
ncbi:MAG TPA: serine/threonine-protein kinase [Gemmatimonadaceae bacterium]|nr:serine/threonine-protein kinase [Gemmatimonadaceae bacterium]